MAGLALICPGCGAQRDFDAATPSGSYPCPSCARETELHVFPAMARGVTAGRTGESLRDHAEAACYNHAAKRATAVCSSCGRFVCALCEISLHGKTICPACAESGVSKGEQPGRILQMDSLALNIAVLSWFPLYMFYVFTAPIIVYLCIRYWRTPQTFRGRRYWRFIAALVLVAVEFVAGTAVIATMFMASKK